MARAIREAMREENVSMTMLSARTGIHLTTLSSYFAGRITVNSEKVESMLRALDRLEPAARAIEQRLDSGLGQGLGRAKSRPRT